MKGLVYPRLLEAEEEGLWKRSVFLFMGALRGESGWRAPLQGTKVILRHVKEGRGNGASLSLYRFSEGNLQEGSYTVDSDRHVTEGSGNGEFLYGEGILPVCLLGRTVCFIYFSAMYNFEGLWPYFLPQHTKGFLFGLRQAEPKVY